MAAKALFAETGISECHEREMNPHVQLYKYLTLLPRALTVKEALPSPALLTRGNRVASRLINRLTKNIDHVFWET